MVKGPVSPLLSDLSPWHPINSLSLAIAAIHTSDSAHVFQIWIHLYIYIYIYTCIQFMVEIQEKIQQSFHLGSKFIRTPGTFQHAMLRGNGTRGLIVEELKLFLENHHVSWVNRLAMVIFESYVGLPEDILNVGQGLIYCCYHRRFTIGIKHY